MSLLLIGLNFVRVDSKAIIVNGHNRCKRIQEYEQILPKSKIIIPISTWTSETASYTDTQDSDNCVSDNEEDKQNHCDHIESI